MKDLPYLETILQLTQRALDSSYEGSELQTTFQNQKDRILKDIEDYHLANPPKKVKKAKKKKKRG